MEKINVQIGNRIRLIRENLKISRKELAKELNVTCQFLGMVERGISALSYEKLKKLCDFTHITSDFYLFGYTNNECNFVKTLTQEQRQLYVHLINNILMK